jgi:hypothetical protein
MLFQDQPPPTPISAVASYKRAGIEYVVKLVPGKARPLEVWKGKQLIAEGLRESYKPWKLIVADVDGDGIPEICAGVYRKTPYTPAWARSIFVYTFDGKELIRKYMGSSLGRPTYDFTFTPEKTQRLLTVQEGLNGQVLSGWDWNGLGFNRHRKEIEAMTIVIQGWEKQVLKLVINGKPKSLRLSELP